MRIVGFLTFGVLLSTASILLAQETVEHSGRKIIVQVQPRYPELAKRMNLSGTVKLSADVAPDGKVKAVEALGGSPLLVQACKDVIKEWKFAPAAEASKETIELRFHPTN